MIQKKTLQATIFSQHHKYIFLALILALLLQNAIGQKANETTNTNDTTEILLLVEKGSTLTDILPNEALGYLNSAYKKSADAGYLKGIALASAKLGKWYFGNDISKSLLLGSKALGIYENNSWASIENIAEVQLLLAESYDELGQTDSSAYFYYLLGDEIENHDLNDPEFAINLCTKLAIFWLNLDNGTITNKEYVKTIRNLVAKAKANASLIKDSADAASAVYFIQGAYYQGIKKYDSSRYYYLNYITAREALNKLRITRKISTYFNIAETYLEEIKPNEAMNYVNAIKEIGKIPQNTQYLAFYITFIDFLTAKALYQQKNTKPLLNY